MGDPITYLTVEVTDPNRTNEVRDAINEWKAEWASIVTGEETIASQYHGIDVEKAKGVVETVGERGDRALIVAMNDTTRIGTGRLFVRVADGLLLIDRVTGGENRGVDVVDYFRRHYDFAGAGFHA